MRLLAFPVAIVALAATAAPAVARPAPTTVTISMADRRFTPQIIRLNQGQLYRLRLVNPDRTEHSFYAPEFFSTVKLYPRDAGKLSDNRLVVPAGTTQSIRLTPEVATHFNLKSTPALDVASGMEGQILVYPR